MIEEIEKSICTLSTVYKCIYQFMLSLATLLLEDDNFNFNLKFSLSVQGVRYHIPT